jgi:hypothetical protein
LVLGDSHTQNGLDIEPYFTNSLNLSASAESYYFCYNKLKYFTDRDIPIKILILGYGAHSLSKTLDSIWLMSEVNFIDKFTYYSPILDYNTIPSYFKMVNWGNFTYFKLLPALVYQPFYVLERRLLLHKLPFIGGFNSNNNQLKNDKNFNTQNKKSQFILSQIQLYYLGEIIELCKSNEIKLILLNVPVYSGNLASTPPIKNSSINILDYGDLWKGNEIYFADYVHLNKKGAKELSTIVAKELKTQLIE